MSEHQPYSITSDMMFPVEQIGESIGRTEEGTVPPELRLRWINRIRTIRGSLAIEGQPRTGP